ncbi:MAG: hypothetical protein GDA43_09865 [Hormoscilla sp. SP5CHS1]|nr:hypothetical protein [Hormoscilla sp. SP5CHS1]
MAPGKKSGSISRWLTFVTQPTTLLGMTTMQIIHLYLKLLGEDYAELRYFLDNPNQYQSRRLLLADIAELIQMAVRVACAQRNRDYYLRLAVDYAITGRRLYDWLDGDSRFLQRTLDKHRREGIIYSEQ